MNTNNLITNFTIVNARLVDCGISAAALDMGSIQNFKLKYFLDQKTKQSASKTSGSTAKNENPKDNESISHDQPTKKESSPMTNGGMSDMEWSNELTRGFFLLLLVLSLGLGHFATPRAREHCSSWANTFRGICYLKELPSDLLR